MVIVATKILKPTIKIVYKIQNPQLNVLCVYIKEQYKL